LSISGPILSRRQCKILQADKAMLQVNSKSATSRSFQVDALSGDLSKSFLSQHDMKMARGRKCRVAVGLEDFALRGKTQGDTFSTRSGQIHWEVGQRVVLLHQLGDWIQIEE